MAKKTESVKRQSIQKKIILPFICIIILFMLGILWLSYYLLTNHQNQQSLHNIQKIYQSLDEHVRSTALLSMSEADYLYNIKTLPYRRSADMFNKKLAELEKKGTSVFFTPEDLGDEAPLLSAFVNEGQSSPFFKIIVHQTKGQIESFIATVSPIQSESTTQPIITKTPLRQFIKSQDVIAGYFVRGQFEGKPYIRLIESSDAIESNIAIQNKLIQRLAAYKKQDAQFLSSVSVNGQSYAVLFQEIDRHPHIYLAVLKPKVPINLKLVKYVCLTLLGILLATFWILTIYSMIIKKITSSIDILGTVAERVSKGDLEQHIYMDSNDEVGELASIFNTMIKNLKESSQIILEEKNRSEAILSCLPEGIVVTDPDHNVIMANDISESIFNFEFKKIKNKPLIENIHNKALKKVMKDIAVQNNPISSHEVTIDVEGEENETIQKIYTLVSSNVTSSDNRGIGIITVVRDITHEKELENLRDGFLRTVSHELRTPLTSVIGFVELCINDKNDLPKDIKKYMTIAHNEAKSLQNLIDDLLDLSRISAGKIHMHYSTFSVKELFDGIVTSFKPLAKRKNLELSHSLKKSIKIEADESKVRRILINLVSNAIKFTDKGSIELSVSSDSDTNSVTFATKDTGIGLLNSEKKVIFEKFRQVDYSNTRKFEGIGLGLTIVKQLVELHNGSISVESEYKKGATFLVTLPKKQPREEQPLLPNQ